MSWLSKAVGAVSKVFKPIEKIVGPIVKSAVNSIPVIGPIAVTVQDTLKRGIWDPLRHSGTDPGEVVTQIIEGAKTAAGQTVNAAVTGAQAGIYAQQQTWNMQQSLQNPVVVIGLIGLGMLALGFGKRR